MEGIDEDHDLEDTSLRQWPQAEYEHAWLDLDLDCAKA